MTIHSDHPFMAPEDQRDPVRRLRSRFGGTVSLWTSGSPEARAGLTVSSYVVAPGEPGHAMALLDPEASFTETMLETRTAVLQLLEWEHRDLADAFAGLAPAPGGVFTLGSWEDTAWGPRLADATSWAGLRLVDGPPTEVGWSLLVDAVIEHVEIGEEQAPLVHRRGRYQRPSPRPAD